MNNLVYALVPISIIVLNGPLIKSYYKQTIRNKTNCERISNRKDLCYLSKKKKCPMRSYKQCTNNILPLNRCDCRRINYEICPYKNKECVYSMGGGNTGVSNTGEIKYPIHYPQVNIYKSKISSFDTLK